MRLDLPVAMPRLLLASVSSVLLLLAPVARGEGAPPEASQPADSDVLAAYHALKPDALQAKKIDALPQGKFRRIEVKQRMRSASFGHSTTLAVPVQEGPARQFFVEYGRSTNRPAQLFGPFALQ